MANQSQSTHTTSTGVASDQVHAAFLMSDSLLNTDLLSLMSQTPPSVMVSYSKLQRDQSTHEMPIVMVKDLEKSAGDTVDFDMVLQTTGEGTIGDETIAGRGVPTLFSRDALRIDQTRYGADVGGRMTQKRTPWDLAKAARSGVAGWFGRRFDQLIHVHLSGARGSQDNVSWTLPVPDTTEKTNRLAALAVNPIRPPTTNRYMIAGGGDDVTDLSTTDTLKLRDLQTLVTELRGLSVQLPYMSMRTTQHMKIPQWCLFVSPEVHRYLTAGIKANEWRQMVAAASSRARMLDNHPLFTNQAFEYEGVIIKPIRRPILFNAGDSVKTTDSNTGNELSHDVPDSITVHRSILVGGQALAMAFGNANSGSGAHAFPMRWSDQMKDHDNAREVVGSTMVGMSKIRFRNSDGELTDHGVFALDSYAPKVDSAAGRAALASIEASN